MINKIALTNKWKNWLPVFIFIAIAIVFRFYRNSTANYYLLAGSDGPYLPVQVKSIFEHYRLAFADMPLLFVLCALIAKFLFLMHIGTEHECILMSVRLVDTILPPLAAIPVFNIAKELISNNIKSKFLNYFLVAFAILNFTPLFLFSFQLQKNGLAAIFIFSYLYYVIKIIKYHQRIDIIKAIIALVLCLLTHFGSFGLLLFISMTILLFWYLAGRKKTGINAIKNTIGIFVIFFAALFLIAILDYSRFTRILHVPLKLFEAPALLFALNGQNFILHGPTLFILLSMNLLAITGLIFLFNNRHNIEGYKKIAGLALATCALLLSNPLLGLEWASRLFMITYIPITIFYLIIYNSISNKWLKILTIPVFVFLFILSIATSAFQKTYMAIDSASFLELQQMKDKHFVLKNDAIVARQSLRILSNWVFESKGIDQYLLTKDEFNKYAGVYLLKQIKGKNPFARGGEPSVGDSIRLVYKGEHFELYRMTSNAQLPVKAEKIFKGVRGTIQSIEGNKILITDFKTQKIREVQYDPGNTSFPKLFKGMKVEINGEWKPFSLTIDAETIKEVNNFDNN